MRENERMIRLTFLFILILGVFIASEGAEPNRFEIVVSHKERLSLLKKQGFQPRVVYDIGAYRGSWSQEIEKVFGGAKFFLFEANESNKVFLQQQPFPYFLAALSDREGVATFYANNSSGDSLFKEQTKFYAGRNCLEKEVHVTTLAAMVKEHNLPLPDLIKVDVQGAEQLIIQGSPAIFSHAEVVIVETKVLEYNKNAPLMFEILSTMHGLGYRMLDILELHYLPTKELNEVDLLFVKQDSHLIKSGILW